MAGNLGASTPLATRSCSRPGVPRLKAGTALTRTRALAEGSAGKAAKGAGAGGKAAKNAARNDAEGNGASSTTAGAKAPASQPARALKIASAAKISASKSLARKLSEEQKAASAAAHATAQRGADAGPVRAQAARAVAEAADLAAQAAQADLLAHAAGKAERGEPHVLELQVLKTENEALQRMVLQLAADKADAQRRLARLREQNSLGSMEEELLSAETATPAPAVEAATPVPPPPTPSHDELQQLADAATAAGERLFTFPEGALPCGSAALLFYNRSAGPLPGGEGARPAVKLGWNGWESQQTVGMTRMGSLRGGEWWRAELDVPALLTGAEFTVLDQGAGVHDNNRGRNFSLDLSGTVTEQQLHVRRLEVYEAAEAQRAAARAEEERRAHAAAREAGRVDAERARQSFRARKRREAQQEAALAVRDRRGELAKTATEPGRAGVFAWIGGPPVAGRTATLAYNTDAGALRGTPDVFVVLGFDGWHLKKTKHAMQIMAPADVTSAGLDPGHWMAVKLDMDPHAQQVDFVFVNGGRSVWDNNTQKDYHTALAGTLTDNELGALLAERLLEADPEQTARQEELAAKRALEKAEIKYEASAARRASQAAFLFTVPSPPVAGQAVEVMYNPDLTPLRGRPEVFVRGGFNRWTQSQFAPTAMKPTGVGGFCSATIQVPRRAHSLELVFLDSGDTHGGFTDDNRGLSYHLPVAGGEGPGQEPLRVVHVAAEMAPIAKEGGLGDVVTALGRAVQEEGHEVEIVLPKYDCINYDLVQGLELVKEFWHNGVEVKVWRGVVEDLKTTFLEPCNGMFWVGRIYTEMNADRHRFGVWCEAALEYLRHHADARAPDILHAHDWQSAPCTWMEHGTSRTAFTIHNLNYGADLIGRAMAAAAVATTVSPTYAQEVSGHPAVAPNMAKFYGIRNGIDPEIWDPAEDEYLPEPYSADTWRAGKAAAKAELRAKMNLSTADVPLVGVVTRLTHQKGVHLIKHAAWRTLERGAQFVLLGSAPDPRVQAEFNALAADLARQYPDRARLWFAYNEPLSHLIYAGADMLLVPSMFEPCGLTQMIAMRYGTIPVVRKTGGLNDTVFDVDHDVERAAAAGMLVNGFSFEGTDAPGIDYALGRALTAWYGKREWWEDLVTRVMKMDWSWAKPALDYIELYYKALRR